MAHGTPDWGVTAGGATVYQLTDMAELAVRLGSIVTFDRRGDVVFLDSFEDGFAHWLTDKAGAGSLVALSRATARHNGLSARLVGGTGAAAWAQIIFQGPRPVLAGLGVEYSFNPISTIGILTLLLYLYDGTNRTLYEVHWDDATNSLRYRDANWVLQTFATNVDLLADVALFHTWKLVVNAEDQEYARLILNGSTYDLSGIPARVTADSRFPSLSAVVTVNGRAGGTSTVYIDDVILTQNEHT
jgi:hypothetical protein